jgi:hypothetical protein
MAAGAVLAVAALAVMVEWTLWAAPSGPAPGERAPDEPAPTGPPAAAPVVAPHLAATVELRRTVQRPRTVAIAVENRGAEPVRVVRAELVGASFGAAGPFQADVQVPAGLVRDVFLRHGVARCGGQAAPPAAPARAVLEVVSVDGRHHRLVLPLPYPNGSLDRRLSEDCTARVLARAVRVDLDRLSPLPDGRLRGEVVLRRVAGDEPIELHDVAGTVLFRVVAAPRHAPRPVAVLPPGRDRLVVPVTIDAARCGGHAIGEAKQRYTIHVWVTVGPDQRLHTTVEPGATHRRQLVDLQDRRCATSP